MNKLEIAVLVGLTVGAFLGGLAFFGVSVNHEKLGSTGNAAETYYNSQWLVGGNQIGPTGTLDLNQQFGTCNLIGGAAGIAATSTKSFDCAVTGILTADYVEADLPNTAPLTPGAGFIVTRAVASSTAGYITFSIANFSGAASTTLGTNLTNGIEYFTWR